MRPGRLRDAAALVARHPSGCWAMRNELAPLGLHRQASPCLAVACQALPYPAVPSHRPRISARVGPEKGGAGPGRQAHWWVAAGLLKRHWLDIAGALLARPDSLVTPRQAQSGDGVERRMQFPLSFFFFAVVDPLSLVLGMMVRQHEEDLGAQRRRSWAVKCRQQTAPEPTARSPMADRRRVNVVRT